MEFDFDEWMNVYDTDLPEFEFRRHLVLDELVLQAPPGFEQASRNLVARLNAIHATCTPNQALKIAFEMLAERVEIVDDLEARASSCQAERNNGR